MFTGHMTWNRRLMAPKYCKYVARINPRPADIPDVWQLNVKVYAQTKRANARVHQYVRHIEIILVLYLPKRELLRELH